MKVTIKPTTQAISVSKCDHRFDAVMSFSLQTDTRVQNSIYAAELYGFKNNVRLGAFCSSLIANYNAGIAEAEAGGLMRHDVYLATDMWHNPTSGAYEVIPDYYVTAWTAAGVSAFPETAVLGASKSSQSPNHGQQLFVATNGRLGYNSTTQTMGTSNLSELYDINTYEKQFLSAIINRTPSTTSFRNGQQGAATPNIPKWIGSRNSTPSPSPATGQGTTYYGSGLGYPATAFSRSVFASFPSTYRWWNSWNTNGNTKSQADAYMTSNIADTLVNKGWYRDFMHFHDARNNGTMPQIDYLLDLFRDTVGSNFVWACSVGEAIEYMFIRELCSRVFAIERNNEVTVYADINDSFKGTFTSGISNDVDLSLLNIPLSVKVDVTGTYLAGKNVVCSTGKIRSLGSNVYVIELPYLAHMEEFITATLSEGTGGYYNETRPTGSISIAGNTLSVTTNIPTKATLFSVATGGNDYDSLPDGRSLVFKTVHEFPVITGRTYRVGVISEFNQANLIV